MTVGVQAEQLPQRLIALGTIYGVVHRSLGKRIVGL